MDGRATYIYLLIEFQSTVDRFMALRIATAGISDSSLQRRSTLELVDSIVRWMQSCPKDKAQSKTYKEYTRLNGGIYNVGNCSKKT